MYTPAIYTLSLHDALPILENSVHGMHCSLQDQQTIAASIMKVSETIFGYRLAAFIEMLQLCANLKDWKYLASDTFEYTTDRKSTRLNSSHTVISYAVFCLK